MIQFHVGRTTKLCLSVAQARGSSVGAGRSDGGARAHAPLVEGASRDGGTHAVYGDGASDREGGRPRADRLVASGRQPGRVAGSAASGKDFRRRREARLAASSRRAGRVGGGDGASCTAGGGASLDWRAREGARGVGPEREGGRRQRCIRQEGMQAAVCGLTGGDDASGRRARGRRQRCPELVSACVSVSG